MTTPWPPVGRELSAREFFSLVDLSRPYIPELHDDEDDEEEQE
ncbi:hypothetical protein OG754_19255 [Streptomyces decoyicus]|nr:hypothetical protein [Streptomyces decoyicus]